MQKEIKRKGGLLKVERAYIVADTTTKYELNASDLLLMKFWMHIYQSEEKGLVLVWLIYLLKISTLIVFDNVVN